MVSQKSLPCLYVVGTPIGNLADLSRRVEVIFSDVALIAAEDTRVTRKLLTHLDLKKKLLRCDEFSVEKAKLTIAECMSQGQSVAFVSDAGTPCISDPGDRLVAYVVKQGYDVIGIPGPSSVTLALSISGFKCTPFVFYGFIPKKGKLKNQYFEEMYTGTYTAVFFENTKRLIKILRLFAVHMPDRQLFVCRELTKLYEEHFRGTALEILDQIGARSLKGEVTVVVESQP